MASSTTTKTIGFALNKRDSQTVYVPGMVGRSEICHHSVAVVKTTPMTMPCPVRSVATHR